MNEPLKPGVAILLIGFVYDKTIEITKMDPQIIRSLVGYTCTAKELKTGVLI